MGLLNLLLVALAAVPSTLGAAVGTSTPRPLVLWHGMGVYAHHVPQVLTERGSRRLSFFTRNG